MTQDWKRNINIGNSINKKRIRMKGCVGDIVARCNTKIPTYILHLVAENVKKYGAKCPVKRLVKNIKVRTGQRMYIQKYRVFRKGDVIDYIETPDGRYGTRGLSRMKKKKPTKEQMAEINKQNKERRCRAYLMEYFRPGDTFATWTYRPSARPPDMKAALKDFQTSVRKIRKEYRKRGYELFWIRNIERGTRGAWHIHIAVNAIPGTAEILKQTWTKGGIYLETIKDSEKFGDDDMSRLAAYLTKDAHLGEKKEDGTREKPRLREASYGHSRNMQLPPVRKRKLRHWKEEIKPKKGYYISKLWEGINPYTGMKYRRYTMIRLERRHDDEGADLCSHHARGSNRKRRKLRGCRGVHHPKGA